MLTCVGLVLTRFRLVLIRVDLCWYSCIRIDVIFLNNYLYDGKIILFLGLGGLCAALCIRENILPAVRFRLCFLYLLSRPYGYDVLRVFIQQFFLSKRYLGFERQILLLMPFNSSMLHTTWMLEDDHVRANFSEILKKTFTTCLAFRCIFIRLYSGGRVVSLYTVCYKYYIQLTPVNSNTG